MIYVCKYGEYNPEQPRIARIVNALADAGNEITWVVSEDPTNTKNVIALKSKSKIEYLKSATKRLNKIITKKDIVYGYMHIGGAVGYLATRRNRAKFVYDYPDPWKGWYFYKTNKDSLIWAASRKLFYFLEKLMYNSAKLVLTASWSQLEFLIKQHGKKRSATTIFNCPPIDIFNPNNTDNNLAKKLGIEKKQILIYSGYVGSEYGIDLLVDAVNILSKNNKNIVLIILGRYGSKEYFNLLNEKIKKYSLEKQVIINPPVPFARVPNFLNLASVGFVPFRNIFYNSVGGPNKLFEYMSCNVVPVCSNLTEFRKHIKEKETGMLAIPDSAESIAKITEYLLNNDNLRNKIKKTNLERVNRKYNWELQKNKLIATINSVK